MRYSALLVFGVTFVTLLLGLAGSLRAQSPTPWLSPQETPYDFNLGRVWRGAMQPPAQLLGYEDGEAYADYGAVLRVLERYATSDRVLVRRTGQTNERRPMHLVVVSSPDNLARIDRIQARNHRLTEGRSPLAENELGQLIANQPIIVWLSYNIHGDEAAGTEAAMRVLHTLVDDDSDEVRAWLRDVVVVMNPCQNPDGRERFVVWAKAHGIGRPETFAYEKENPWNVQGRYNHYTFDLNRDMVPLSQVESRNTAAAYLEWMPQVAADHHGETSEYFFPPAAAPINPNLPLESTVHWQEVFGRGNAEAFDGQGWMYYVRDVFDVFYPGYWDSWPSLQGATGMTYETSGGGKEGLNKRRDDGTIMTLRQAIAKHYVASLATIRTAAANREERLREFHFNFVEAVESGRKGEVQQVYFPASGDLGRRNALLRTLVAQGIEVRLVTAETRLAHATDFLGAKLDPLTLSAGAAVVDLAQPRGRLARALLEPHTEMDAAFLERQQRKVARNRERGENVPEDHYEFYDQTAWSLPLMQGVPAYYSASRLEYPGEIAVAGQFDRRSMIGTPTTDVTAWVLPSGYASSPRLAIRLLRRGYRVSTSVRPFETEGHRFERGSFIVRAERNPPDVAELLQHDPLDSGQPVALSTAFPSEGQTGIGSESVYALREPKVLLVAGEPTDPSSYGAMRFLLRSMEDLDVVPVAAQTLVEVDLRGFNVVILPSGDAADWAAVWDEEERTRLKSWVEQGGTLICLGGAAEFAAEADTGWTSARVVGHPLEAGAESETPAFDDLPLEVPGALLRARPAPEHFMTFGYDQSPMAYFVNGDGWFHPTSTGTNVVTFAEEDLWVAGHVWAGNTERLAAGAAAVIDEPVGEGHIILFSDEPGDRAMWLGSVPMLVNALLYGPSLRNDVGSYVR